MRLNQKLTPLLSGRVIQAVSQQAGTVQMTFTDSSVLTIKVAQPLAQEVNPSAKIKVVRQGGTGMSLEFTDDTALEITLAEATPITLLRDAQGRLDHAD